MPATPNPSVSVFHFTSRISNAKIRKYKLATERGMGGRYANNDTSVSESPENPKQSVEASTMEPPAKKPKLKLSVRPPSESPDTIAVSRPKRESSLRIRYSENMIIDAADVEDMDLDQRPKPSPAASSDLSSLTSAPPVEKEPMPAKQSTPPPAKKRDYSRDFMSYYVADADDDDKEEADEPPKVAPVPSKPAPPQQAPPSVNQTQPKSSSHLEHHPQVPTYPKPRSHAPRQPRAPIIQPTVHLIDIPRKSVKPAEPDTIEGMIAKIESLSVALNNFGGPPSVAKSPEPKTKDASNLQAEKKDADDLLAMFEGDDESSTGDDESNKEAARLKGKLDTTGEPDEPLIYGIQFIQNALKSWAHQRLTAQYTQHYMQYQQHVVDANPQKRGPGRPRKFDGSDEGPLSINPPPLNIKFKLSDTPEGVAIQAFQEVLDSGCLQMNISLPQALARALRLLYAQIDNLINQGSRTEAAWRCMSYGAQIAAQKVRVESWEDAHAKAREEMARQHYLSQQQIMQQMGVAQYHRNQQTLEQAQQQQHAIELERKRSLQHAAQQPHLTQYLTKPMALDSQPTAGSPGHPHAPSPVNGPSPNTPGPSNTNGTPVSAHGMPPQSDPATDEKGVALDKIKLYMPNFLPRSGQSMKFSFAPSNELALKAFGAQAFPTAQAQHYVANRGPMVANPQLSSGHAHMPNGIAPTPTVPSNAPISIAAEVKRRMSSGAGLPNGTGAVHGMDAVMANNDAVAQNGSLTPNETPVNGHSPPSTKVAEPSPDDQTSGSPRAGAIVIDQ